MLEDGRSVFKLSRRFFGVVIVLAIGMFCLQAFVLLTFRSEAMLSTEVSHDVLTGLRIAIT